MIFASVFIFTYSKKYTVRERLLMSISWIPKAAVPATLAGVFYTEAIAKGDAYADF